MLDTYKAEFVLKIDPEADTSALVSSDSWRKLLLDIINAKSMSAVKYTYPLENLEVSIKDGNISVSWNTIKLIDRVFLLSLLQKLVYQGEKYFGNCVVDYSKPFKSFAHNGYAVSIYEYNNMYRSDGSKICYCGYEECNDSCDN
jgi:hypothetical protein